jgi:ABC-type glycerol-3-phosphate transport system substrate-binding protein
MRIPWKVLTITILGIFVLIACEPEPPAPEPRPTPEPTPSPSPIPVIAPVEIHVGWGYALENEALKQLFLSQVELFEASHPHIKVSLVEWGWDALEFPKQLAEGNVPDVMEIAATENNLVIENGYAADLTDFMKSWDVLPDFNDLIIAPFVRENRIYGVPKIVYIIGLFYDKTLFSQAGLIDQVGEATPPETWEEFAVTARTISEKTDAAGFCILTQHNQGGWNFMNWGWQAGGEFERRVDGRWQAIFDEPPIVEALAFIKRLRWEENAFQEDLMLDAGGLFPKLAHHECGMAFIAADWFQTITGNHGGNLEDFGLSKLPSGPGGNTNLMGGAFTIVKAGLPVEVQKAAFEWMIWHGFSDEALEEELKSPEGRNRWNFVNQSLLYKPQSPSAQREKDMVDKYRGIPYYKNYVEAAAKYAHIEPPIAPQDLYALLDTVLWEVLTNEDADPESLLREAAQTFQKEYLDNR